jgi:hypothetical protein
MDLRNCRDNPIPQDGVSRVSGNIAFDSDEVVVQPVKFGR